MQARKRVAHALFIADNPLVAGGEGNHARVGLFRVRRGIHWRSLFRPMSPDRGGVRIYAGSTICPRRNDVLAKARPYNGKSGAIVAAPSRRAQVAAVPAVLSRSGIK